MAKWHTKKMISPVDKEKIDEEQKIIDELI